MRPRLWAVLCAALALVAGAALAVGLAPGAAPPAPERVVLPAPTAHTGPVRLLLDTACCAEHLAQHGFTVTPDVDGVLGRVDLTVPPGWRVEPVPGSDAWRVIRVPDQTEVGTFQGRLLGVHTHQEG